MIFQKHNENQNSKWKDDCEFSGFRDLPHIFGMFTIFSPAGLQIDLAQSSGGVGWSHGHHGIVISDRTFDLAGLERRRKPLNIISRVSVSFFAFLKHHLGYRRPPNDLLWNPVQSLCNELTRLNFIYHLSTKKRIARNWDWLGVRIFLC